ncbi:hypothetical protein C8F01DRAFT_1367033 [Mycena amicta]|nr:hypothetical protein C8F01DRAFT_1367033 [Mycena amicta]
MHSKLGFIFIALVVICVDALPLNAPPDSSWRRELTGHLESRIAPAHDWRREDLESRIAPAHDWRREDLEARSGGEFDMDSYAAYFDRRAEENVEI